DPKAGPAEREFPFPGMRSGPPPTDTDGKAGGASGELHSPFQKYLAATRHQVELWDKRLAALKAHEGGRSRARQDQIASLESTANAVKRDLESLHTLYPVDRPQQRQW